MKIKAILPFLLAVLLLLAGCTGNVTDTTENTEAPSAFTDLSEYKIVYALSSSKEVTAEIRQVISSFESAYGIKLSYDSDLDLTGSETVENDALEILIGDTNRPESSAARKDLPPSYSYIIRISGKKLVILGSTDDMTVKAVKAFRDLILSNEKLAIEENYSSVVDMTEDLVPANSLLRKIAGEYTVVFPASSKTGENTLAKDFASALTDRAGTKVTTAGDKAEDKGKEILVGDTNRPQSAAHASSLSYYDYRISVDGEKIVVNAGSKTALGWALESLLASMADESLDISKNSESTVIFGKNFNPIASDISLFTPSWSGSYTPPAWMLDFSEKTYAVTCGTDARITFKAHRGDRANYPENSIEGLASAILAGVDSVEVDVRLTADGVAVLMHDETLNRTTNAGKFMSKPGYPSSAKVTDWTYAQLQSLSLIDDRGKQTEYKIPTLYEALLLCSGKIFIQVDDKSETLKIDTELYAMAEDTDSKECFFHYYGIETMEKWAKRDPEDTEFAAYAAKCRSYLSESGHSLRRVYWPNDTNTYAGGLKETQQWWQQLTSRGKMMIWTENVPLISKYVSTNYSSSTSNS